MHESKNIKVERLGEHLRSFFPFYSIDNSHITQAFADRFEPLPARDTAGLFLLLRTPFVCILEQETIYYVIFDAINAGRCYDCFREHYKNPG